MGTKRLVIAEKPSTGRTIAAFLGCARRGEGWIAGDRWVVTWCQGHLVDLVEPNGYAGTGWDGPWCAERLPMVPDPFEWRVTDAGRRQFEVIRALLRDPGVSEVVHACDPDREGEGIARRVLRAAGNDKPVLRLWANSLEDAALAKAFAELRPDSDYDGLGDAAEGRALADWLVGMNMTRALTVATGRRSNSGRVMTPTLHLVCERTRANCDFESVPFWQVAVTTDVGLELRCERMERREAAEAAMARMEGHDLVLDRVSRRHVSVSPPPLYDLTSLQKDASARFGMSAKQALDALQRLYERRLTTYPRTDSRYVTSDDADGLAALLASPDLAGIAGCEPGTQGRTVAQAVSDAEVSGHTALLPTPLLDARAFEELSGSDRNVAALVVVRMFVAVSGAQEAERCRLDGHVADVAVSGTASHETEPGWREVERACAHLPRQRDAAPDVTVPDSVAAGDALPIASLELAEGRTRPPQLYTDRTLLAAMEHADRLVDDADMRRSLRESESHAGGLGTPATRAATIEKLVSLGYVERAKGSYVATAEGMDVDASEPARMRDVGLTAELEGHLTQVERGERSLADFMERTRSFVEASVADVLTSADPAATRAASGRNEVGTCPRCGMRMVLSRAGTAVWCESRRLERAADGDMRCVDEGCGYRFPTTVCGKRLTERQVRTLLERGRVSVRGLVGKRGRFDADVVLDPQGRWPTRLEFPGGRARRASGSGRRG